MAKTDETLDTSVDAAAETPPVASKKGYIKNTWNGLDHFECEMCPYDSLDEGAMLRHRDDAHTAPRAVSGLWIPPQRLNRFNQPVEEVK